MSAPSSIVLTVAEDAAPGEVVGGLTVLERAVLQAQHDGVQTIYIPAGVPLPAREFAVEIIRCQTSDSALATLPTRPGDEVCGVRVFDRDSAKLAQRKLYRGLQKSFQGPIDALINCHFSIRITSVLVHTRITPNMVTGFALLLGVVAVALLLIGGQWPIVSAGILLFWQSIFDSCDGELARLRYQFSRFGQWLDNIADDIVDTGVMVGLGVATGEPLWMWIGIGAGAGRVFSQLSLYAFVTRAGGDFRNFRWFFETEVESLDEVYDLRSPLAMLRAFARRDVYLFLWAVLCAIGQLEIATAYGAAIAAFSAVPTLIHIIVMSRRSRQR